MIGPDSYVGLSTATRKCRFDKGLEAFLSNYMCMRHNKILSKTVHIFHCASQLLNDTIHIIEITSNHFDYALVVSKWSQSINIGLNNR